jgi:hypothetical protein
MTAVVGARSHGVAIHLMRSAARGGALIGLAVVLGIVMLQIVDESGIPSGGRSGGGSNNVTTTTEGSSGRPPSEITVIVLNGSGIEGLAGNVSNNLRGLGYLLLAPADATAQQGNTVACRAGFDREADALATQVGFGAQVIPFPDVPPSGTENADCIVILGT